MLQDLSKLKWSMFNDDDFMKQKVYWLGPYRAAFTVSQHGIQVFAKRIPHPTYRPYDRPRPYVTQYTIEITYGPYGESGESKTMPVKTSLAQAKAEALKIANKLIEIGVTFQE